MGSVPLRVPKQVWTARTVGTLGKFSEVMLTIAAGVRIIIGPALRAVAARTGTEVAYALARISNGSGIIQPFLDCPHPNRFIAWVSQSLSFEGASQTFCFPIF